MEESHSEPRVGRHHSADNKNDSEDSCPSLARSDSGQGKSLSSVDIPEENISPDQAKHLESTKEIDDMSENGIFEETPWKTNNQNSLSRHEKTGICANKDSGFEKSPASQHSKCNHHLSETNHEDMSNRKKQKDIFEGPVSVLTDVDRGKSEKSSLKRQDCLQFDSLDVNSFDKDKPFCVYGSNIMPSPEVSLPSSRDSHNSALTQNLVNTVHECNRLPCNNVLNNMQAQSVVNGYNNDDNTTNPYPVGVQNGCGQLLTSTLSEAASSVCHMSHQGMVPNKTLDNMVKELTLAKKKISELENENGNLYKCYEHTLFNLHHDVTSNYWKNKYLEIKKKLETKECELQAKQRELQAIQEELQAKEEELNLQRVDLACLEALRHDLKVKDHELQTLREQCQTLMFQNEGHELHKESMTASSNMSDDEELLSVVHRRTNENRSDETQLKTV